jgi:hypothetical protein
MAPYKLMRLVDNVGDGKFPRVGKGIQEEVVFQEGAIGRAP